jgi:hypothetical protein
MKSITKLKHFFIVMAMLAPIASYQTKLLATTPPFSTNMDKMNRFIVAGGSTVAGIWSVLVFCKKADSINGCISSLLSSRKGFVEFFCVAAFALVLQFSETIRKKIWLEEDSKG